MDCTIPYEWKEKPINITLSEPVLEVVKEKWNEYGFSEESGYFLKPRSIQNLTRIKESLSDFPYCNCKSTY